MKFGPVHHPLEFTDFYRGYFCKLLIIREIIFFISKHRCPFVFSALRSFAVRCNVFCEFLQWILRQNPRGKCLFFPNLIRLTPANFWAFRIRISDDLWSKYCMDWTEQNLLNTVRTLYFKIGSFPLAGMIITCNPFPAKIIPPFSPY